MGVDSMSDFMCCRGQLVGAKDPSMSSTSVAVGAAASAFGTTPVLMVDKDERRILARTRPRVERSPIVVFAQRTTKYERTSKEFAATEKIRKRRKTATKRDDRGQTSGWTGRGREEIEGQRIRTRVTPQRTCSG